MQTPTPIKTPDVESVTPTRIEELGSGTLRTLLLTAPGSTEQYAAVDILCEAFDGALLADTEFRKAINMDDGRVYIDWDRVEKYADKLVHNTYDADRADVGTCIVLRVACALATGRLTPSTARTLAGSLAVAGRRERPALSQ